MGRCHARNGGLRAMPKPVRVAAHAQIPIPASWIGNGSTDGAGVVRLVTPCIVVSHPALVSRTTRYPARHGVPRLGASVAASLSVSTTAAPAQADRACTERARGREHRARTARRDGLQLVGERMRDCNSAGCSVRRVGCNVQHSECNVRTCGMPLVATDSTLSSVRAASGAADPRWEGV